jgi:hypothetical protein
MPSARSHYENLPLAYIDGWRAHQLGYVTGEPNPYHAVTQAHSHAAWAEGHNARRYAISSRDSLALDDYEPRYYL